jgi:hypothetical protein
MKKISNNKKYRLIGSIWTSAYLFARSLFELINTYLISMIDDHDNAKIGAISVTDCVCDIDHGYTGSTCELIIISRSSSSAPSSSSSPTGLVKKLRKVIVMV